MEDNLSRAPVPTVEQLSARPPPPSSGSWKATLHLADNRFYETLISQQRPSSFTLSAGERIVQVKTICNFRFEFTTSLRRKLVIGQHPVFDHLPDCPESSFYSKFNGSNSLVGNV